MAEQVRFRFLEKIICKIESLRISPVVLALYLTFLISLREILEQHFFEKSYSRYQFMHHFFFFTFVFMAGILIIRFFSRGQVIQTTLIVTSGFFLIMFPPLIDSLIFTRRVPYEYILPREFLKNFITLFLFTPKAGIGTIFEIYGMLGLASLYIWIRTRSLGRSFLAGFFLYFLGACSATPRLFAPFPSITNILFRQSRHIIYFMLYFFLNLLVGLRLLYKINKALPVAILKELASPRSLHFVFMVGAGTFFNKSLHFFSFPDCLYVLLSMILLLILWLGTVLINNVFDLDIDRISNPARPLVEGKVCPVTYLHLSFVLFLLSFLISLLLGVLPFLLTLIIILSALAYSVPPVRLRNKLYSTSLIGWGSCLAFFIGSFNRTPIAYLSLDRKILATAAVLFAALSLGPLVKDLKDFQGDLRHGVRNFFTVYGSEKGKKIVTVLLALSLVLPLALFHNLMDIIFFSLLSLLVSLLFYYKEKLYISYVGYGSVFAYCIFRFLS